MIKGDVSQALLLQNSLITKTSSKNAARKNSYLSNHDDDFNRILNSKKNNESVNSSKIASEDSEKNVKEQVDEISTLEQDEEVKDENIEEKDLLSELNMLFEDLIKTLQSSNIVDENNLNELTKEIQNLLSVLSTNGYNVNFGEELNELKDLITSFNLISSSQLMQNEDLMNTIEEKLNEVLDMIETIKTSNNQNKDSESLIQNQIMHDDNSNDIQTSNTDKEDINSQAIGYRSEARDDNNSKEISGKNVLDNEYIKKQNNPSIKKSTNANINALLEGNTENINFNNISLDNINSVQTFDANKVLVSNTPKLDLSIFNQVLEGAKLSVSEDVSEMFLKLKPDNLGNLSMKISIERGMMVARFEVESQIVKEAIESNLEDLRNALSDKGFEIKEFNVSVNKDSNNQESSFSYFTKKKNKKQLIDNKQINIDTYYSNHQTINDINTSINYLA